MYSCTVNQDVFTAIPVSDIQEVLFQINIDNNIYIIMPVNTFEQE